MNSCEGMAQIMEANLFTSGTLQGLLHTAARVIQRERSILLFSTSRTDVGKTTVRMEDFVFGSEITGFAVWLTKWIPSISQHVLPLFDYPKEGEHHMWCNRHPFRRKQHIPPLGELLSAEVPDGRSEDNPRRSISHKIS